MVASKGACLQRRCYEGCLNVHILYWQAGEEYAGGLASVGFIGLFGVMRFGISEF